MFSSITVTSSVQFSRLVVFNSLWPHGLQYARLPCPAPTPRACSKSCPSSRWCHPTIPSELTDLNQWYGLAVFLHRGWVGWIPSWTQRTWVWASSGRQWRTGKPGKLQSMGSQRVGHEWETELDWTEAGDYWGRHCMHRSQRIGHDWVTEQCNFLNLLVKSRCT